MHLNTVSQAADVYVLFRTVEGAVKAQVKILVKKRAIHRLVDIKIGR